MAGFPSVYDTTTGGAFPEAPIDGNTYGRKDSGWVEVSGGGSGTPSVPADSQAYGFKDTGSGASSVRVQELKENSFSFTNANTGQAMSSIPMKDADSYSEYGFTGTSEGFSQFPCGTLNQALPVNKFFQLDLLMDGGDFDASLIKFQNSEIISESSNSIQITILRGEVAGIGAGTWQLSVEPSNGPSQQIITNSREFGFEVLPDGLALYTATGGRTVVTNGGDVCDNLVVSVSGQSSGPTVTAELILANNMSAALPQGTSVAVASDIATGFSPLISDGSGIFSPVTGADGVTDLNFSNEALTQKIGQGVGWITVFSDIVFSNNEAGYQGSIVVKDVFDFTKFDSYKVSLTSEDLLTSNDFSGDGANDYTLRMLSSGTNTLSTTSTTYATWGRSSNVDNKTVLKSENGSGTAQSSLQKIPVATYDISNVPRQTVRVEFTVAKAGPTNSNNSYTIDSVCVYSDANLIPHKDEAIACIKYPNDSSQEGVGTPKGFDIQLSTLNVSKPFKVVVQGRG